MSVAIQWIKDNYSYKTTTTSKVGFSKIKKLRVRFVYIYIYIYIYIYKVSCFTCRKSIYQHQIFLLPSIYKI